MITKRFPFQASTLCAGGTLLVLGSFLTLNLAGCGGGGGGGIINPTPNGTSTPAPASLRFQLQTADTANATGGTVTLSSSSGRTYTQTANKSGVVTFSGIVPGIYNLTFRVTQADGTLSTITTRSLVVTSPLASGAVPFTLVQGSTGDSNPFTITGRVLLNPAGTSDPDGNSATANCSTVQTPITDALNITVIDLNSTNGVAAIATTVRAAQPSSTSTAQRGLYTISIPYRPRSFRVVVSNSNDAPFAGTSASTTFPAAGTSVTNIDVCTNNSNTAPQPAVTATPSPTPFATATTVGTPAATATRTPPATIQPTNTAVPTATTVPTATAVPTNTPIGGIGTPGPTPNITAIATAAAVRRR